MSAITREAIERKIWLNRDDPSAKNIYDKISALLGHDLAELCSKGLVYDELIGAAEHWHHVRNDLNWEADGWVQAAADADAGLEEVVVRLLAGVERPTS